MNRLAMQLMALPGRVNRREEGQSMIEYALLAGLISIVAVAVIVLIGPYLQNMFQQVVNAFGLA